MGEFEDEYSAALEGEVRETRGALLNDTIGVLGPADPICLPETATVHEAVDTMLGRRQYGVLITDAGGRLTGIFTERDVLTRVVGKGLDASQLVREIGHHIGGGGGGRPTLAEAGGKNPAGLRDALEAGKQAIAAALK